MSTPEQTPSADHSAAHPSTSATAQYPSLAGRVVFISGGASGIGEAFVRAFAAQGARVGFVDVDEAAGTRLAAQLGANVRFGRCDVTDTAALQQAIADVRAHFGPIGVLVNNAANDQRHMLADATPAFFDQTVAVNLRHHLFAAQAVVADMQALGGGSIINLGSISWMVKGANFPAYAMCKSAVQGLTRALARDLGRLNIRVNTLVPGWVMTDKQLRLWVKPESGAEIDAAQCLPGRVVAADIAAMALFLAADDSRMCSAQDFVVDAGWT